AEPVPARATAPAGDAGDRLAAVEVRDEAGASAVAGPSLAAAPVFEQTPVFDEAPVFEERPASESAQHAEAGSALAPGTDRTGATGEGASQGPAEDDLPITIELETEPEPEIVGDLDALLVDLDIAADVPTAPQRPDDLEVDL